MASAEEHAPADAPAAPAAAGSVAPAGDWLHRYTRFIERRRNAVIVSWVAILIAGLYGITQVFANLKLQARAVQRHPRGGASAYPRAASGARAKPRGSVLERPTSLTLALRAQIEPITGDANDLARKALVANFPTRARSVTTTVMLTAADGVSPLAASPAARAASLRLAAFASPYIQSGLLAADSGANYFQFVDLAMPLRAAPMLAPAGEACLVQYFSTEGITLSKRYKAFLEALRAETEAAVQASAGALVSGITGNLPINADSASSITLDIGRSDAITVTISFLLLACALRSLRLIALTFAALVAAFGGAFLLTWPLTKAMSTPNFVTSLLIATLVSLSLDYSLFLLTHLKKSILAGVPMPAAVEAMLRTSGHTVLVSGATLAACFLVLGIFPVSIVRTPGIATTFSVCMSVLANLTLTPALLLRFPRFFAGERAGCCGMRKQAHADAASVQWDSVTNGKAADATELAAPATNGEANGAIDLAEGKEGEAEPAGQSGKLAALLAGPQRLLTWLAPWQRIAVVTFRYRWSVSVVLIALLVAPFAYRLPAFDVSESLRNVMPRGYESVETLYELQNRFGPGSVAAAQLLGVSSSPVVGAALTPQFFASAATVVRGVLAISSPAGVLQPSDVFGLAFAAGGPANATAVSAQLASVAQCPSMSAAVCRAFCPPDACLLRIVQAASLSNDMRAMSLSLSIRVPRSSKEGIDWTIAVRDVLQAANAADPAGVTWHLLVEASSDSIRYIYQRLGTLIGVTAAVIFCILFVGFRSVAIAVRAVMTLTVMEVCVWGAGTATFVQGVLNPGGVLGTMSNETSFFWLIPILAFSLITGLGLDYVRALASLLPASRLRMRHPRRISSCCHPSARSAWLDGATATPLRWVCCAAAP